MTLFFSGAVLSAGSSAVGATIGPGAHLKCWTNANDAGRPILDFPMSSGWASGVLLSSGSYNLANVPLVAGAYQPGGVVNFFGVYDASGNKHIFGSMGIPGAGADFTISDNSIPPGRTIKVTAWTLSTGFQMFARAQNIINQAGPASPDFLAAITLAGSYNQPAMRTVSTSTGQVIEVEMLEGQRGFVPTQIST